MLEISEKEKDKPYQNEKILISQKYLKEEYGIKMTCVGFTWYNIEKIKDSNADSNISKKL